MRTKLVSINFSVRHGEVPAEAISLSAISHVSLLRRARTQARNNGKINVI